MTSSNNSLRALLQRPRAAIMGVVNTTPDSFSDGGQFSSHACAVEHALRLVEQGADILDIGGESTRPGAAKVTLDHELERVIPVIEALVSQTPTPISIDTSKPEVMQAALEAGALMVNDVNGLREDGALQVVAKAKALACVMHMQGQPGTMQLSPDYSDVIADVIEFLRTRIEACLKAGINRSDIIVDPGIGFGKSIDHNLRLLKNTALLARQTGCDVLIGVSRKSLIDSLLGRPVDKRLAGSLGLAVQAVINGAKIVRVHDVAETHDAVRCVEAVSSADV